MKVKCWINKPHSFGLGFNVWLTGAEIFLAFLTIVIMWYDRKYPSWKEREDRQADMESEYPIRPLNEDNRLKSIPTLTIGKKEEICKVE